MAGVDSAISWLCCQARVLIDILILSEMERKISSNCEISKAEEWLLSILNKIGKTRIPDLEVEDFYEDFVKSNGGCNKEKLKPWEELVGIRLSLRILDNIMVEQFQRQEEQHLLIDNLSNEKLTLENEVGTLREQLSHLEQSSSESRQKSDAILKENWKLKDKFANFKYMLAGTGSLEHLFDDYTAACQHAAITAANEITSKLDDVLVEEDRLRYKGSLGPFHEVFKESFPL